MDLLLLISIVLLIWLFVKIPMEAVILIIALAVILEWLFRDGKEEK